MKRLSVLVIAALLAAALGGCRFAVVEGDAIRVFGGATLAEGEQVFAGDEIGQEQLSEKEAKALDAALEEGKREAAGLETPAPTPTATPEVIDPSKLIGLHSRDEEGDYRVRKLQERLQELKYLDGEADGVFGSKTLKALKHFQYDNGLDMTGVLDGATKAALYPPPAVTTPPDEVLAAQGSTGEAVQAIQEKLRQYGFSDRKVDGEYDEEMAEEVMQFQTYGVKYYGTEFDEPVDVNALPEEPTLVANDAELPSMPTPTPDFLPDMPALVPAATLRPAYAVDGAVSKTLYGYLLSDRFPTYRQTVQRGDWGEEVRRVQRRLIVLEFLYEPVSGDYDEVTIEAMKAFQRRNGLQQTGIADGETQRLMYSMDAKAAEQVEKPYYIKVSLDDQRVYVYRWDSGDYNYLIKTMICSTGLGDSTPKGVFVSPGHRDSRWHYFVDFHCWAQYAFIIRGNILFHSVLYSSRDDSSLRESSVYNLGHKASHGCVRLRVVDAKWIYEHCGEGQVIEIY